jgi:hypothetical protein
MVFMVIVFNKTTWMLTPWYQNSYIYDEQNVSLWNVGYLNHFLQLSGRGDFAEKSEC